MNCKNCIHSYSDMKHCEEKNMCFLKQLKFEEMKEEDLEDCHYYSIGK